jgi:hypothetical protein
MKPRPDRFLSDDVIPHDSEQFDYIRELHDYLWRVVRTQIPGASGDLSLYIDATVLILEGNAKSRSLLGEPVGAIINPRTGETETFYRG